MTYNVLQTADVYDDEWYTRHRREGHRLVHAYLRLKPRLMAELRRAEAQLLGTDGGATADGDASVGVNYIQSIGMYDVSYYTIL